MDHERLRRPGGVNLDLVAARHGHTGPHGHEVAARDREVRDGSVLTLQLDRDVEHPDDGALEDVGKHRAEIEGDGHQTDPAVISTCGTGTTRCGVPLATRGARGDSAPLATADGPRHATRVRRGRPTRERTPHPPG